MVKIKMIFCTDISGMTMRCSEATRAVVCGELRSCNLSSFRRWSDPSGEGLRIRLRDGVPGAASRGVPQPTARGSVGVLPSKGAHPRYQVSSGSSAVETPDMYI